MHPKMLVSVLPVSLSYTLKYVVCIFFLVWLLSLNIVRNNHAVIWSCSSLIFMSFPQIPWFLFILGVGNCQLKKKKNPLSTHFLLHTLLVHNTLDKILILKSYLPFLRTFPPILLHYSSFSISISFAPTQSHVPLFISLAIIISLIFDKCILFSMPPLQSGMGSYSIIKYWPSL